MNLKEHYVKGQDDVSKDENKFFHEMLMITYSSKKNKYELLKDRYKKMIDGDKSELWGTLEKKMGMLIEELTSYLEIVSDFNHIQSLCGKNRFDLSTVKEKHLKLAESGVQKVGFFKSVTKEEKLKKYKEEIETLKDRSEVLEKLLNILAKVVIDYEIEQVKQRKRLRFDSAIQSFAYKKIKELEDTMDFWQCVVDDRIIEGDNNVKMEQQLSEIKEEE